MSEQVNGQLTLYPVDSPASPFPWLESKKGKTTTVTSGLRCCGLSENCARIASSVRMYLESSRLPPGKWSRIWSAQAITSSCSILKLRLSELGTGGQGCSSPGSQMWPTPTVAGCTIATEKRINLLAAGKTIFTSNQGVHGGGEQSAGACVSPDEKAVYDAMCSGCAGDARWGQSQELADGRCWAAEPDVGRVAHGIPAGVDRLKCLGNAVVPQQAYPIFKALAEELGGSNGFGTERV